MQCTAGPGEKRAAMDASIEDCILIVRVVLLVNLDLWKGLLVLGASPRTFVMASNWVSLVVWVANASKTIKGLLNALTLVWQRWMVTPAAVQMAKASASTTCGATSSATCVKWTCAHLMI